MKNEKMFFIGIIVVTLAIVTGAVFFLTRSDQSKPGDENALAGTPVDFARLLPSDSPRITANPEASSSASVTLVEFADFQCPACATYEPIVKQVIGEFKNDLTFVFRHYPLPIHKNAQRAAMAAEAAGKQGKFFDMLDALYTKQNEWSEKGNPDENFIQYARDLKLNETKFKDDLDTGDSKTKIQRDISDGNALGVTGTPTFFLNGHKLQNPQSIDDFKTLVKAAILQSPISQAPAEEAYHIHADFKVYADGKPLDFSGAKYQSTEEKEMHSDVHFHNNSDDMIHIHKKGTTLGTFFQSLGCTLSNDCLTLDTGTKYCNAGGKTLKLYVNMKPVTPLESYEPQDLDRILLTYGSETPEQITGQLVKVNDRACIYSETCPERGTPPPEECVGGLGTGCEK